ncbi:uncharacterized protein LOC132167629 [Corylus avellana]|uniref:uncharacterized protein LOC132167629 n=1 Tax=Corylus avellana TaxID=13451 RepID=UPI00286BAC2A|nr:uncharacterized protein LOC132167629 [Corylus avellana]
MRSNRKTPKKLEEKKRKDHLGFDAPKHFKKKFNNHNFTPLNANISKVLMEIKKDLKYRRPPGAPQNQISNRYCEFYEVNGHYTEGCIALTLSRYPREERARWEEPRGRPARLIHEPQNKANIPEIHTIIGGFPGGGESGRARKAYAHQLESSHEVYTIGRPMKQSRRSEMIIGFSDADYVDILHPNTDTLVVTLTVANHNVHHILVDNRSSVDILYWYAFKNLNLGQEKIIPTSCPLMGFTGEQFQLVESIELLVIAGSYPRQVMVMVRFLLVNRPSAYNAIIGRTTLNKLRAITSTPHLKMKFPMDHGVGEVRGDQRAARQCYNISMKECPRTLAPRSTSKEER